MHHEMIEVKLDDKFTVTVDLETAQQLKDEDFTASYLKIIRHEMARELNPKNDKGLTSQSEKMMECTLWKSKYPTKVDHEATLTFLALRKQYAKEFLDKKTSKNHLWSKIQEQMNEMGYFVGETLAGREKCRQKFSNLQSTYFRTKEKRRRTGEGKILDPPYFKELDEILGDRHNTQPLLLIDSLESSVVTPCFSKCINNPSKCKDGPFTSNVSCGSKISSEENFITYNTQDSRFSSDAPCSSKSSNNVNITSNNLKGEDNRFGSNKHTVKPSTPRNKALEELVAIQKENQAERREEFKAMMTFFTQQNMNRHQEMMTLINRSTNDNRHRSTNKSKRKRTSSNDSESDNWSPTLF